MYVVLHSDNAFCVHRVCLYFERVYNTDELMASSWNKKKYLRIVIFYVSSNLGNVYPVDISGILSKTRHLKLYQSNFLTSMIKLQFVQPSSTFNDEQFPDNSQSYNIFYSKQRLYNKYSGIWFSTVKQYIIRSSNKQ